MDEFKFSPKGHTYTLNGKKLTGVTTILGVVSKGDGLIQWAANEAVRAIEAVWHGGVLYKKIEVAQVLKDACSAWKGTRDSAGDKGKDVHAQIEIIVKDAIQNHNGYIEAVRIELDDKYANPQIQYFYQWARGFQFLESEKSVYSKSLWFAGTLDIIARSLSDGQIYIVDIKTAKSIYATNFWQMSGYKFCIDEMGLYKDIKGFIVVRLGKDGSCETQENFSYDDNIEGFKAALTIYRKLNLIK